MYLIYNVFIKTYNLKCLKKASETLVNISQKIKPGTQTNVDIDIEISNLSHIVTLSLPCKSM